MRWVQDPGSATGFNWEEVEDKKVPFPVEGQGAGGDITPRLGLAVLENLFEGGH